MRAVDRDEVSLFVAASPAVVYGLVADVTRMPELSPEVRECRWLAGASHAAEGARFAAPNKLRRGPSFVNKPVIVTAEPNRAIGWSRTSPFGDAVVWTYRLHPCAGGTLVTESYEVTKPISRPGSLIVRVMFGTGDRRTQLRKGMEQTLLRIKVLVEDDPRPSAPGPA